MDEWIPCLVQMRTLEEGGRKNPPPLTYRVDADVPGRGMRMVRIRFEWYADPPKIEHAKMLFLANIKVPMGTHMVLKEGPTHVGAIVVLGGDECPQCVLPEECPKCERFLCANCGKAVNWDDGVDDDLPDWCSTCWTNREENSK